MNQNLKLLLLLFVSCGLGIGIYFLFFNKSQASASIQVSTSTPAPTPYISAEKKQAIENIKNTITNEFNKKSNSQLFSTNPVIINKINALAICFIDEYISSNIENIKSDSDLLKVDFSKLNEKTASVLYKCLKDNRLLVIFLYCLEEFDSCTYLLNDIAKSVFGGDFNENTQFDIFSNDMKFSENEQKIINNFKQKCQVFSNAVKDSQSVFKKYLNEQFNTDIFSYNGFLSIQVKNLATCFVNEYQKSNINIDLSKVDFLAIDVNKMSNIFLPCLSRHLAIFLYCLSNFNCPETSFDQLLKIIFDEKNFSLNIPFDLSKNIMNFTLDEQKIINDIKNLCIK